MVNGTPVYTIKTAPVLYEQLVAPLGWLPRDISAHALWYYYTLARKNWEQENVNPIVMIGEKDPEFNYRQLFKSIAVIYGILPEHMVPHWKSVDMQATAMQLPRLPDEERYRFNRPMEILT